VLAYRGTPGDTGVAGAAHRPATGAEGEPVRRITVLLAMLGLLATMLVTSAGADIDTHRSYLIISPRALPADLTSAVAAAGGTVTNTIPEVAIAVASSSEPDFPERAAHLGTVVPNLRLQWVDPARAVQGPSVQQLDDPPFSGSDDFFFDLQWGHAAIAAVDAWNAGERGAGARVAVLDTGYDLTHPDLVPNINLDLSADMTGEGLQYTLPDPFSHGTHVAGTIAAAENDFGVIGVAPEAELVLVKVLSDEGSGTFEDVIAGIVHAGNVGADVINMSLGGELPRRGVPEEDLSAAGAAVLANAVGRATTYAYRQGATVIASAGNDASDGDKDQDLLHLPSDAPFVLSIAATAPIGWATDPLTTFLDNPASYTNHGRSVIDLAAPGGDFVYPGEEDCAVAGLVRPCWVFDLVFSTGNGGWYWSAGTSMAAPHAAGVAALIVGANGGSLHPARVERALVRSADDLGPAGRDPFYGMGRVNAGNAAG
jgi:lantibiotic leader peptide-processing serine protease